MAMIFVSLVIFVTSVTIVIMIVVTVVIMIVVTVVTMSVAVAVTVAVRRQIDCRHHRKSKDAGA